MELQLPEYHLDSALHQSKNSLVFRGRHAHHGRQVILKILKGSQPTSDRLARFEYESEITRMLSEVCSVKVQDFRLVDGLWVLELEDLGAASLDRLELAGAFEPGDFLELAMKIVDLVGAMHEKGVIHKDLNPANIIYNPQTGVVRLIDFGIASTLAREQTPFQGTRLLQGTPAYMSPEQTGRMNRSLDFRSDFYSLGVTFYHLLADRPPFRSTDLLELVHAHIAREPPPLGDSVPEALAAIIMKLLAKEPRARYGSASGLKQDLLRCFRTWKSNRRIPAFSLDQHPTGRGLTTPQKLYGREGEIKRILEAFERAARGEGRFLTVAGHSGIGKTVLVQETYRRITTRRGFFVSGKFDQLSGNKPYSALFDAIGQLSRLLLTEDESTQMAWRNKVVEALGPNGRLLAEAAPDFLSLTGPLPPPLKVEPSEKHNRFVWLLTQFFDCMARQEHPLVLFLDDLQWADAASLSFLESFFSRISTDIAILIVGAYRDNEVDDTHPLRLMLGRMEDAGLPLAGLSLGPLNIDELTAWLVDALALKKTATVELAKLVKAKTDGNPFFTIQFLETLLDRGSISFDEAAQRWIWDSARLRALDITDNVLLITRERLERLPDLTLDLIKWVSCLGNRFDLGLLAEIRGRPLAEIARGIWPALEADVLVPLSEDYRLLLTQTGAGKSELCRELRFVHDRLQESAQNLLSQEERARIHLKTARIMEKRTGQGVSLLEWVDHYNQGRSLLHDEAERVSLSRLNLEAGKKAHDAAAFGAAYRYFRTGLILLGLPQLVNEKNGRTLRDFKERKPRNYALGKALYEHAAEAAYLINDLETCENLIDTLVAQMEFPLEKQKAMEILIMAYKTLGKAEAAVDLGFRYLRELGMEIPPKPTREVCDRVNRELHEVLLNRKVASLAELPLMEDPHQLALLDTMNAFFTATGITDPGWSSYLAIQEVLISARHGNTLNSIAGYANYAILTCPMYGDFDLAAQFYRLAMTLIDHFKAEYHKPYVMGYGAFALRIFHDPLASIGPSIRDNYHLGLQLGDLFFATLTPYFQFLTDFPAGQPLDRLEKNLEAGHEAMTKYNVDYFINWERPALQAVQCLLGRTERPWRLAGTVMDEETWLADERVDPTSRLFYECFKVLICVHFNRMEEAYACLQPEMFMHHRMGTADVMLQIYRILVLVAMLPKLKEKAAEKAGTWIDKSHENLKLWAEKAPMNWSGWRALVEAELARHAGEDKLAETLYANAVDQAVEQGFPHLEALACEMAARFYLDRGKSRLAGYHIRDAHYANRRWGATTKVRDLEVNYPYLLNTQELASSVSMEDTAGITTDVQDPALIDFRSVLKASQAISGEIVLGQLLSRLMTLFLENAGAQRGVLLLPDGSSWRVEAEVATKGVFSSPGVSMEAFEDLPKKVTQYVLATGKDVIVNDLDQDRLFAQDPYLRNIKFGSFICTPIQHQGATVAVLYLEHREARDVFTDERLEILQLLVSQTAISLENARLYDELEHKVAERTEQLRAALGREQERLAQLKQAQTQLVHMGKMASLAPLTAGVAHEINNPNTFIQGGAHNLSRLLGEFRGVLTEMAGDDSEILAFLADNFEKAEQLIGRVLEGSERIAGIVADLNVFTRHGQAKRKRVVLNEGLAATVNLVHSNFADSVDIACQFQKKLELECQPGQLDQVFLNLTLNACQALVEKPSQDGKRGKLTITTGIEDRMAYIRFEDNGPGIPRAIRDRVFEPFFTTRIVGEGRGLGLAIASEIVAAHGGKILLASIPGEGCSFTVFLPLDESNKDGLP